MLNRWTTWILPWWLLACPSGDGFALIHMAAIMPRQPRHEILGINLPLTETATRPELKSILLCSADSLHGASLYLASPLPRKPTGRIAMA